MTVEEIKEFLRKEIEHDWKVVRDDREMITLYEKRNEINSKCYEIFKSSKKEHIQHAIELENLFRTFFKTNYDEER